MSIAAPEKTVDPIERVIGIVGAVCTIVLAGVAIYGIRVALKTVKAIKLQAAIMRRQTTAARISAEATEKSVRLQEIQLRQWIDTDDWKAESAHYFDNAIQATLTISFDIVNPTKMPLMLKTITISAGKDIKGVSLEYVLAPDNTYPASIAIILTGDSFAKYKKHELVLIVTGLIGFEDAFEDLRHQAFGYTCRCGTPNWFEFEVYEGPLPKGDSEAKEDKNPN